MSHSFDELRKKHAYISYDSCEHSLQDNRLQLCFTYTIAELDSFVTRWSFPYQEAYLNEELIDRLSFDLGMVELISYYKITCPRQIIINCGELSKDQELFYNKLIYNGLGEFMYRNDIKISQEELFKITYDRNDQQKIIHSDQTFDGALIPVGGGKDSCVSLELVNEDRKAAYAINPNTTILNVISRSQVNETLSVSRQFDAGMLEYNRQGYLNGHTPFSALVAFSGFLCAALNGYRYITLSNEGSANEPTVPHSFVNHQYSKSFEFESDFAAYIRSITDLDVRYFSFLRPLSELQIASLFARYPQYHDVFRSCNVGSKKGIWCGDCAKCLFVYIILLPFLSEKELITIFGEKILDKQSLEKDFRGLIGYDEVKPFECVGTRREVLVCLNDFIARGGTSCLSDKYRDYIIQRKEEIEPLLHAYSEENDLPSEYAEIIRRNIAYEDR